MRIVLLTFIGLLLAMPALAEIYKRTLPDGSVEFTDRPTSSDDEPLKLDPINTVPAPKRSGLNSAASSNDGSASSPYTSLSITSPQNDATVRENAGNVTVSLSVNPALARGHQFGVKLDNGEEIFSSSGQVGFSNIDRGTHSLSARVTDASGKTLISASSSFHLIRISNINNPQGTGSSSSGVPTAPRATMAPSIPRP